MSTPGQQGPATQSMGSSYWPRPELSNPTAQRYHFHLQSPSTQMQHPRVISTIVEDPVSDHEPELPSITRQPTTSALRAQRSSYNARSTPTTELESLFDKERERNWAMTIPDEYKPSQLSFQKRHRAALGTCIPIFYAIVQLLMLAYFLDLYLTLPRRRLSQLPRISPQYSIWPYISCTGALNLNAFKIFAFLISFFFCGTFVFDFLVSLHTYPGYWLRRILVLIAIIWSALFIWLVFASKDATSHVHLYLVSVKVITSLAIKTMSYFTNHQIRKYYPALKSDRVANTSHRWKQLVLLCAFPVAILANIGIYACMNETENQTPGTSCYIIVAIAAVADWIYALVDVLFVLNLAYDINHHDHLEIARGVDANAVEDIERHLSVGMV